MRKQNKVSSIHHMSISVDGVLRQYKKRKIDFCNHDDGRQMTDAEARLVFENAKTEGKRVLPSGDCWRFDYQKGCPGHVCSILPNDEKQSEIDQEWIEYLKSKGHLIITLKNPSNEPIKQLNLFSVNDVKKCLSKPINPSTFDLDLKLGLKTTINHKK